VSRNNAGAKRGVPYLPGCHSGRAQRGPESITTILSVSLRRCPSSGPVAMDSGLAAEPVIGPDPLAAPRNDAAVLAARFRGRGLGRARPEMEKGSARDAGSSPDPRALAPRGAKAGRCFSMKRRPGSKTASPPILRRPARGVEALFQSGPRWPYPFRLPCSREGRLTTAAEASTSLGGWHRRYEMPPRTPSEARLVRRDRLGFGCRSGVYVWHPSFRIPRPPPPIPAS